MKNDKLLMVPALLATACGIAPAETPQKPNIVFMLADDMGIGDVGCYGQKLIKTPNIDALAGESMLFSHHYSGSTVSAPSRCCLMTGKHTGHAFVRGNKGEKTHSGADVVLGASNIGLPTSLTAAALRSRVLLYAASPAFQTDAVVRIDGMGSFTVLDDAEYTAKWERAALAADEVLNLPGFGKEFYALRATDLADAGNTTPSEFLYRTFFNSRDMESRHFPPYYWGNANTVPSQNLVDAFPMANGYPITEEESGYDPSDPYVGRDRRFYLNVYYHGCPFGNSGQPINVMTDGKDGLNYNQNASVSGYYLAKFMSGNATMLNPSQATNSQHYYPEFRRAEVFLNYAEAANEAWGPYGKGASCIYSAYDVVKTIRERSGGITDTEYLDKVASEGKDAFRTLIQNERRLELAFENHRWYDLRRCLLPLAEPAMGVEVSLVDGKLTYEPKFVSERKFNDVKYYYAPMPYDECIKNPEMVNNLGWK